MSKSFLGTGWSFPPRFEKHTGIVMVSDEMDIAESLHILMSTSLQERVMIPSYGSSLTSYLFQPISASQTFLIQEMLTSAITKFEPRIILKSVTLDQSNYMDGEIKVLVDYVVRKTNNRFNQVFPYYQVEGTGIPELYSFQKLIKNG